MANQMIALQSRAPQLPDPSRLTTQYANMMNMVQQNETSKRQAERAQQEMDYATAEETRKKDLHGPALTKAQLDNAVKALELFREQVGDVDENDIAAKEAVRADLVARIPGYDQFIPPASQWTRDTIERLMMDSDKEIDKLYATPVASLEVDVDGNPRSVTVGGLNPQQSPVYDAPPPMANAPRATPTAPQAAAPAGPIPTGKFGETRVVPDSARPLTADQQDHIRRMQEELGMSNTPASFSPGASAEQMTPQRAQQIVDSAVKTRVMAQEDFDQMLAMTPEQNKQPFMEMIRSNGITLQPGGMGQQPQFADLRGQRMQSQTAGLRGAPPMEQTLAQTQPRTITKLQQRDPNVSPLPGSSQVPLSRLGAEKTTETQAAENVRLKMAPAIAAATKNAERAVEKRSEALVAKNETKAAIQSLDKYIEEIDALLRSPDRRFIVGRIEGNLHYLGSLGQNERQAELQAMYDRIKNADTLGSLVEAKQATPTGGSPVGNASNLDVQLIAKSANSLTQTGGVPKFDEDLKKLRREAYRTRQRRIEFYNDRYGDLSAEDPKFKLTVRPIADRYISSKDLLQQKAPVKTPTSRLSAETRAKYGL